MIESTKNKSVGLVRALRDSASHRREEGMFIAEGLRLVRDIALSGPDLIHRIYVTKAALEKLPKELSDMDTELVADHVMDSMSDTNNPQGILAVINMPRYSSEDILGRLPLILILEDIRDPGNMGTIFRAHEAAKGSGIILLGDCTDPFSPKCTRATMGSIIRMPFITVKDVSELSFLNTGEMSIFAADLSGEEYDRTDLAAPCAFIVGNEARGLSETARALADKRINIPMGAPTESLNAAVTSALLSFEAARQRRSKGLWI